MKALIIDNNLPTLEALSYNLLKRRHMIYTARDGRDGLDLARGTLPDVVVLDFTLPSVTGVEVCRLVRKDSDVPIVLLSASADDADRSKGMSVGADAYVAKPYNMLELVAQLETLAEAQGPIIRRDLQVGGVSINSATQEVQVRGQRVELTPRQLKLLYFLAGHPGRAFSKQELLREVWRRYPDTHSDFGSIATQIRKLREIVERDPTSPKLILSVKRIGYKFKRDSEKLGRIRGNRHLTRPVTS